MAWIFSDFRTRFVTFMGSVVFSTDPPKKRGEADFFSALPLLGVRLCPSIFLFSELPVRINSQSMAAVSAPLPPPLDQNGKFYR